MKKEKSHGQAGLTALALIIVILIAAVVILSKAGVFKNIRSEETQANSKEILSAEAEQETAGVRAEIRKFVDVLHNSYEFIITPDVEKHPYDLSRFSNDGTVCVYEDEIYTSRRGIDVSSFQGEIDWQAVAASGIEFVFLRLGYRGYGTEGVIHEDQNFTKYITGAQEAGLDVGAYFFSQAVSEAEAVEEAEFCIKVLDPYEIQLPVVFDAETIGYDDARTDRVSGTQFTKNAVAFCERILAEGKYETAVYSNMKWEAFTYDLTKLADYPIWYADYELLPQTPYRFTWWQYSEKGSVNGISGKVDLDIEIMRK